MQLRHVCSCPPAPVASHRLDGGAERRARAAVVRGALQRGRQPLVELGRLGRQLVLERQRRARPGSSRRPAANSPRLARATPSSPSARARRSVRSASVASTAAASGQLDRLPVAPGALAVAGQHAAAPPPPPRAARPARTPRPPSRRAAQRPLPVALQLVERRRAAARSRRARGAAVPVALAAVRGGLAQRADGLGEVARELGGVGVGVERGEALGAGACPRATGRAPAARPRPRRGARGSRRARCAAAR